MADRPIPCPQPDCDFATRNSGYMGEHLRRRHGVWGGVTGRPVHRRRASKALARVVTPANGHTVAAAQSDTPGSFRVLPFVVLEGDDGSIWMAERVRDGRR